jgi:hypothetical protein
MDWMSLLSAAIPAAANLWAGSQDKKAADNAVGMSRDMWNQAAQYNRPNQSNAWQTSTWDQDPQSGQMTQTVKLNDKDQARLDAARDIYGARMATAGKMNIPAYDPNFDWRGHIPGLAPESQANSALRDLKDPWQNVPNMFQAYGAMQGPPQIQQMAPGMSNSFQQGLRR